MEDRMIALLILLPFVGVFIYAGIHEYSRFKSEGRAEYGLAYDEKTGTTHVAAIPEGEDGFDPDEFDPNDYTNPEAGEESETDDKA